MRAILRWVRCTFLGHLWTPWRSEYGWNLKPENQGMNGSPWERHCIRCQKQEIY